MIHFCRSTIIFCCFFCHAVYSQDVQWASKLLDFSSELTPYEYSASQVLGKPNVLPHPGDNPNAWLPAKPDRIEYVKVGFDYPAKIQQIAIAESYNPSAVYQVFTYDKQGNEYLLNTFSPRPVDLPGRMLNIYIDQTDYEVHAIKVTLNGMSVPGYSGIDAIGISDSKTPIEFEMITADNVTPGLRTEKLTKNINSDFQEMRPLIAPDGKTLFFSRRNHPDNIGGEEDPEDIWFSELDETTGEWKTAQNMGAPLNNAGHNFISSLTADGNAMVVLLGNKYGPSGKMKPGVSISTKTSQGWSEPEELNITNAYIESLDGNYFLANNRRTLIMAVDRFDTHGGKDLYVSFRQHDGRWTEPLNLGPDINTAHNEFSPFLAADDETLYFSSSGFSGFGGSDIYISRRLDATWQNWTEPENLGRDINSPEDDVFFNIPPSGAYAYFSKGMGGADADIYRIELPIFYQPSPVVTVSGKVTGAPSGEPVNARISYELLPEETAVGLTMSDENTGTYQILLPVGASYRYSVAAQGYESLTDIVNLAGQEQYREIVKDITLQEEAEAVASLKEVVSEPATAVADALSTKIFFDFNADNLYRDYHHVLRSIADYLKEQPDVKLEIQGHADSVGDTEYNLRLSHRRARMVMNYLKELGVEESKLLVSSFGETDPIGPNDSEEGRKKNRRVEFRIAQ